MKIIMINKLIKVSKEIFDEIDLYNIIYKEYIVFVKRKFYF